MSGGHPLVCAGCGRTLEDGDRYIEDTASGFVGLEPDPVIDGLIADVVGGDRTLGGAAGGKVVFCEDCTAPGGQYRFRVHHDGDVAA